MKQSILCLLLCLGAQCIAQTGDSLRFIELIPLFSNRVSDGQYDSRIKEEELMKYDDAYVTNRHPLEQSFYNVGFIGKWYTAIGTNKLMSFEMGYAHNEYNGSLKYNLVNFTTYSTTPMVEREKIKGNWASLKTGVARCYYLVPNRKMMFMPEFLVGGDYEGYDRNLRVESGENPNAYAELPSEFHYRLRFGAQIDFKLNYRMTDYIGVGLTLRNVAGLYMVGTYEGVGLLEKESSGSDISIGELDRPLLTFTCYLKPKKKK